MTRDPQASLRKEADQVADALKKAGFRVMPTGSFFMCDPPPIDTDVDLFVYHPVLDYWRWGWEYSDRMELKLGFRPTATWSDPTMQIGYMDMAIAKWHWLNEMLRQDVKTVDHQMLTINRRNVEGVEAADIQPALDMMWWLSSWMKHTSRWSITYAAPQTGDMRSTFRVRNVNVIVVHCYPDFELYKVATRIGRQKNLQDKDKRVELFRKIVEGKHGISGFFKGWSRYKRPDEQLTPSED